jgi:3-oxoadipate enol-lactonase
MRLRRCDRTDALSLTRFHPEALKRQPFTMATLHTQLLADGPGTPVVLSHALGLDQRMWRQTVPLWQGQRPVLAYDHRGHGQSPKAHDAFTLHDLVADAVQVISNVLYQWGRGPVIFVGLSMGGMVAQGLALQAPQWIKGLVLAHTVARYDDAARAAWQQRVHTVMQHGMQGVVDTVLSRYLTADVRASAPELENELRQTLLNNDPLNYINACQAIANVDWWDALPRIQAPTLLIGGAHDVGAPPAAMQAMHQRIHGSRFELLARSSHLGPLEQPAAFASAVQSFIASLEGAPAQQA